MKVKMNKQLWIMRNPDGGVYIETLQAKMEDCWSEFCSPRKIESHSEEGYKPIKVQIVEYNERPRIIRNRKKKAKKK